MTIIWKKEIDNCLLVAKDSYRHTKIANESDDGKKEMVEIPMVDLVIHQRNFRGVFREEPETIVVLYGVNSAYPIDAIARNAIQRWKDDLQGRYAHQYKSKLELYCYIRMSDLGGLTLSEIYDIYRELLIFIHITEKNRRVKALRLNEITYLIRESFPAFIQERIFRSSFTVTKESMLTTQEKYDFPSLSLQERFLKWKKEREDLSQFDIELNLLKNSLSEVLYYIKNLFPSNFFSVQTDISGLANTPQSTKPNVKEPMDKLRYWDEFKWYLKKHLQEEEEEGKEES